MTQDWYYTKDRQAKIGPVSSSQLKEMARSGQLAPTDLVRKDGMPKWVPAGKVQGLFPPTQTTRVNPNPMPESTPESGDDLDTPAVARTPFRRAGTLKSKVLGTWNGLGQKAKIGIVGGSAFVLLALVGFSLGRTGGTSSPGERPPGQGDQPPAKADFSTADYSADFSNIDYSVPKVEYTKGPAGQTLVQRDGDPEEGKPVTETGFTDSIGKFIRHGVRVLWYRKNDKKFAQEEWYDGKRHGTLMSWDNKDRKRLERTYRDGDKHGKETVWGEDGKVGKECYWYKDKQHGSFITYHPSGKKYKEGVYKDGLTHGKWVLWAEDGTKSGEQFYLAGKEHGHFVGLYPNGQKSMEATYVEGKLNGISVEYDPDGRKTLETTYVNGVEHGTRHEWDDKGKEERFEYVHGRFQFEKGGRLSKKGFVKALATIGFGPPTAKFTDKDGRHWVQVGGNQDLQQWVENFGEPQNVRDLIGRQTKDQQWVFRCTDGPVTLQGMIYRAPGGKAGRMAVHQIGFF